MRVLTVDPEHPDPGAIAEAAEVLRGGGLVAFPTETVYGLGARGLRAQEVAKIFAAKGRPSGHPVILHVDGAAMARTLAAEWSDRSERLARAFWPGPLTLVVPRAPRVPPEVSGGLGTVGIRAPRHAVALALIAAVGEPLAAPSANAHTHVSPTTAAHVVRSLAPEHVDLVLDAGPCAHGIESTVLDVRDPPRVLRPGAVSLAQLRALEPGIDYRAIVLEGDAARVAPGMAAKHYAPRAEVVIGSAAELAGNEGAAIVFSAAGRALSASPLVVLPDDPEGYARGIFAALHAVDEAGAARVSIERVPDDEAWTAVKDRLSRAARR